MTIPRALAALTLAVVLAACSGDEDEPTTPTTTPSPSSSTTTRPQPTTTTTRPAPTAPPTTALSFDDCGDARAAGSGPLRRGQPGYSAELDRDGDGVACE